MDKTLLFILAFCVLLIIILFLIIKGQVRKYAELKGRYSDIENEYKKVSAEKIKLWEDLENERKKKMELAEKLSSVSSMSIDDVLQQLQND